MRIVKEIFRAAATVWLVLLMAVLLDIFSAKPALAWDCTRYNFRVTEQGEVQVENRSDNDEPAQSADIWINGEKVLEDVPVPEMEKDTGWTSFAQIYTPRSGDWTWRVKGSKDCEDSGEHEGDEPEPTITSEPTGTLVPKETATDEPTEVHPTEALEPSSTPDPIPEPTLTPDPTPEHTDEPKPSKTPKPTLEPTSKPTSIPPTQPPPTLEPTQIPPSEIPPTRKPDPTHTPIPAVILVVTNTPLPPTPIPTLVATETITPQIAIPAAVACPYTYCPICGGCPGQAQAGVGSGAVDYSDVISEFKPIAYIMLGIFGANTLLRTYGTFRKD